MFFSLFKRPFGVKQTMDKRGTKKDGFKFLTYGLITLRLIKVKKVENFFKTPLPRS